MIKLAKIRILAFLLLMGCCISQDLYAQHGVSDSAKTVAPFKMFDNLYYVGIDWVSSYLLVTDDGLILIDAMYGEFTDHILKSVKDLGFDPGQIKYILCTHAHFDHSEGATALQKATGARVGMTEADWQMTEGILENPYPSINAPLTRDLVLDEGDELRLGKTTLKFYVTPGHTLGVLSISFSVRDGNMAYNAFVMGGAGLNFNGVERTQVYLKTVNRLLGMKDLLQVNVSNHPGAGKIFERAEALKQRKSKELNPFVAPNDYINWLKNKQSEAEKKLIEEREAGNP